MSTGSQQIGPPEALGMDAEFPQLAAILSAGNTTFHYLLFIAGVSMITVALLHRYRKRYKQQVGNRITPQEQIERVRQQRGLRGDLEQLMVEVEQLTKRFATQLDAKSIELDHLLRAADERIVQLKEMTDRYRSQDTGLGAADASGSAPAAPMLTNPFEAQTRNAPADALTGRVYAMADTGLAAAEIARELDEQIGKVELILALREAG